jgi:hypothetical protein
MLLFRQIQFSFPIRLLALHLRSHWVLVFLWLFLGALVTGTAGRMLGMHYLLLTPEYRGEVGFASFFLTGTAFGALVMIWNLTSYLLCAHRFPFLATLSAPFTKFCINNSIIPLAFLAAYLSAAIWFQSHDELTKASEILANLTGFLLGALALIGLLALYLYFTNKDMASFLRPGKFVPRPGGRLLVPGQRIATIGEIKTGATRWRVDTYLTERCKVRLVRSVAHYDPYWLNKVFQQNHANAIVVQGVAMLLLVGHGWLLDVPWAQVPTSVSVFVLASMVMAIFGAITFWFRKWGALVFVALLVMVDWITAKGFFNPRSQAYGLDYTHQAPVNYDYPLLESLASDSLRHLDSLATIGALEHWKARQGSSKPQLVLICTSGGGHKAGLWTIRTLQHIDSVTQGQLLRSTALITGASGGMLGAAYLRECLLQERTTGTASASDPELYRDAGRDLLNPITSALVSNDLIFPHRDYHFAGQRYNIDRGYYFEQQMNENLRQRMRRKVSDYRFAEQTALVPMMVLSPYIINDGRRLLISPLGVSYLARPSVPVRNSLGVEMDGVECSRLFSRHGADSLLFSSALRMNCTFPFILPNAWLPTQPALEIMDAGVRDNFGVDLTVRFAHFFKDWIKENTSGVVVLQIRCFPKIEHIEPARKKGTIGNLITPVETAGRLTNAQDYEQDIQLSLLQDVLAPAPLHIARLEYRPVKQKRSASLSFHLSKREQIDVWEAIGHPENKESVAKVAQWLRQ